MAKGIKTGGRKAGVKNKTTLALQQYVDKVFTFMDPEKLAHSLLQSDNEKVVATVFLRLLEYRYGKPAQPITGPNGDALSFTMTVVNHIERPSRTAAN